MKAGLLYLRPARLVYARTTGPYETSIPAAWSKLQEWAQRAGVTSPTGRGYGLLRDNPSAVGSDKCRYDACMEIEPYIEDRAIRELGMITLPGGSYVRQREKGRYDELITRISSVHSKFDAPSGLFIDNNRPIVTIYLDDPLRFKSGELRADICVPVTAQAHRARTEKAA